MNIGIFGNEGSWYVDDLTRAATELSGRAERLDFRRRQYLEVGAFGAGLPWRQHELDAGNGKAQQTNAGSLQKNTSAMWRHRTCSL